MTDMLAYEFMQRALLAGIIIGVLCSFVSFFVVLKRLSFVGVGISHSALGGVALGLYLGLEPVLTGGLFAVAVAWAIGFVSRHGQIQEDVSIGIFFSAAMAFGIVVMGFTKGYYADLLSFLFGNILAVTTTDLWVLTGVGGVVLILLGLFFKELLLTCFDEESARVGGVPVDQLYYLLLTCIAVTVVIAVKVVGIILASALLVIPAAAAHEITGNFRRMLLVSVILGVLATTGGLSLSYQFDLASGATIVLLASLIFLGVLTFSPRRKLFQQLKNMLSKTKGRPEKTAGQVSKSIP